jgi:hypothetical protein
LIAKHGWRLLHNPNNLAGQILKDKDFPRETFFWRLISGKHLLLHGVVFYPPKTL